MGMASCIAYIGQRGRLKQDTSDRECRPTSICELLWLMSWVPLVRPGVVSCRYSPDSATDPSCRARAGIIRGGQVEGGMGGVQALSSGLR
jgi:hypothetical protein